MPLSGGVTAVVGPNGSGKSNITDAVLFALGEQSPGLLRAGTMGDLIFSGSESLQKTNVAEVTLVLDNSRKNISLPYEEVSVTRRISREGGTEYRINGSRARLSDVRSVAGEAGLGRHSILRQGAVDAIVSGGAEACRLAVEEAAGLGVYRRRRLTSGRRLERANEQLEQSRSIEAELAGQLARIEKEAAAAREYREIESRYRRFSLAHLYRTASRGTSGVEERLRSAGKRLEKLGAGISEAERAEGTADAELRGAEREMLRIEKVAEGLEDAAEGIRRVSLVAGRNALRSESRSGDEDQRQRAVSRLRDEGERVRRELKSLRVRYEESSADHTEREAERVGKAQAAREARERVEKAEKRHAATLRELDRTSARLAAMNSVFVPGVMSRSDAEALRVVGEKLGGAGPPGWDGAEELSGVVAALFDRVSGLGKQADQRRGALRAALGRLSGREKSLRASLRSVAEGPRLYEIVRSKPGYESAVEAAFAEYGGGMLAADIEQGVKMLSDSERVAVRLDASEVGEDHPFDGKPLLECVEITDPRYSGAVERLLGGTYLIETADAASLDNGHVAVTRSGLRLTRTSVSLARAGRYTVEARLAATRRLLEDFEHGPVAALDKREAELKDTGDRVREVQSLTDKVRSCLHRANRAKDALGREALRRLEAQKRTEESAGERETATARLRTELLRREEELDEAAGELDGARRARSVAASERDVARVRAEDAARLQRRVRRAVSEGARRIDRISSSLARVERTEPARIEDPGEVAVRVVAAVERLTTGISERRQRVRALRAEKSGEYRRISASRNELGRQTAELRAEARSERERISGLENALERAKKSVAEAEMEVREEWAATLEDARCEAESLDLSPEKLEAERNRLARRLKRFGDVNLLALSQEEEIRERHDTIRDQRTDAEEAAGDIERIINEVDREIENRFSATFERVRATFSEMVPRMLSGGGGSLELTEEGIEVGVRLGRKGWRSLKVLSGGERSLLALSFLFSILLSRTDGAGTFCILDEAEAALDDVNLARFVAVVDSQRESGQFILVTHQKRTMAAADVLYGVVQDASGATSVVSKRIQGD